MPPQSRGDAAHRRSLVDNVPPTLGSFLNSLPAPLATAVDQGTPTGLSQDETLQVTTPTRLNHFDIPDDEDEEDDDDDDVTLDDEEFQSHYSRHSSPASTSSEDPEDSIADGLPQRFSPGLQRVTSLPASVLHASALTNGHPSKLHTSSSTTSLPPPLPPPLPLYPPFYNRPPTPLPPSPSLTSLLRPPSILTRSTHSTRATTPDSSDVETPNDTEAAVAHSARKAQPPPPTHPKIPTYEYYGFVLYLASSLTFALYLLWSYLPSTFLHALGVTYYPDRWWSLAMPAWIVMLLVFVYVALLSYNVEYLTLPMNSIECVTDDAANIAVLDEKGRIKKGGSKRLEQELLEERQRRPKDSFGRGKKGKNRRRVDGDGQSLSQFYGHGNAIVDAYDPHQPQAGLTWRQVWSIGTDGVMDVPLGGVCEVLYGERDEFQTP